MNFSIFKQKLSIFLCSHQNFAIYMKDKNVYRANISWKPLFIALLYF